MYDLIIIGLGPAGINASIYAKRSGLNILVFEKNMPGGNLHSIKNIENYLGYEKIDGTNLAIQFYRQFKELNVPMINDEVLNIELEGEIKIVKTKDNTYKSKGIIISTGRGPLKLGLKNENISGISTCAVCDGNLYKNKIVAIYAITPKALDDILYLSNIVKKLIVISNKNKLIGNPKLIDMIKKIENIELIFNEEIPTDSAASSFSPTALILNPSFVLNKKNDRANTNI